MEMRSGRPPPSLPPPSRPPPPHAEDEQARLCSDALPSDSFPGATPDRNGTEHWQHGQELSTHDHTFITRPPPQDPHVPHLHVPGDGQSPMVVGVSTLAVLEAEHEAALLRAERARTRKAHAMTTFQQEVSTAAVDHAQLHHWATQMEDDASELQTAERLVETTATAHARGVHASQLENEARRVRAEAQRHAQALRAANARFQKATWAARAAEATAAAAAQAVLVEEQPAAAATPLEDSEVSAVFASSSGAASGVGGRISPSGGRVSPSGSKDERSLWDRLNSPRTLLLGERGSVNGPSGRVYRSTAIWPLMLLPGNAPRSWAIVMVESKVFDPFILIVIFANCVSMAWASPLDPPNTPKQDVLDVLEVTFLYIFTCEMLIKMLAYARPTRTCPPQPSSS